MTVAALLAVALGALFTLRVAAPASPAPPLVKVMWASSVTSEQREAAAARYGLQLHSPHGERTWNYLLLDSSRANLEALVRDPVVQDTDGIDRARFEVQGQTITAAEWITSSYPRLEELAGRGFEEWRSARTAGALVIAAGWLIALSHPSVRVHLARGIPELSPLGLGLFRIVFGATLLVVLPHAAELPGGAFPRELHRPAGLFADWEWVHQLAATSTASDAILWLAYAALLLFTAGVLPRVSYVVAMTAITVLAFVILQYKSAHDWGLPLVTLWGLALVPWDSALTLVPFRARTPAGSRRLGFALWFPGFMIGLAFLAAAYAKWDTSGVHWVLNGAVKYHFVEDFPQAQVDWGLWIARHPAVAVLFSALAIAVEALFFLHAFSPRVSVRVAFGGAGLALLAGIYLFQGVFWPLWWTLFLVFLPWQRLAGAVEGWRVLEGTRGGAPRANPAAAWPRAHLALVAGLVILQIFASARRVEIEPFISDYGMYSWSWPSPAAFDEAQARRWRTYHLVLPPDGREVTSELRSVPNAADAIEKAVENALAKQPLGDADRAALKRIAASYEEQFGTPLPALGVLLDEPAFDWRSGRFVQKRAGYPVGTLHLWNGEFVPANE
jgi:hypothetical protein